MLYQNPSMIRRHGWRAAALGMGLLSCCQGWAQEKDPMVIRGSIASVGQALSDSDAAEVEGAGDNLVVTGELVFKKSWGNSFGFVHVRGSQGMPVYNNMEPEVAEGMPGYSYGSNDVSLGMSDTVEFAAAFWSYTMLDALTFTVGKIDISAFFETNALANDSSRQFIAYPFVNNPTVRFAFHEPGYILKLHPGDFFYAQVGVFEDREQPEELVSELEQKFYALEFGFHYEPFEEEGNLRLLAWNSDYFEQGGFAINLDQMFGETFGMFLRYGMLRDAIYTVPLDVTEMPSSDTEQAFSIGTRINFGEENHVGLGYALQAPADPEMSAMTWLEGYVSVNLDEGVFATFDLQYIVNPDFDSERTALWIPGVRFFAQFM